MLYVYIYIYYINIFQLLIDLGAEIDRKTGMWEDTALFTAVSYNYREVVRVLLEAGADPNIKDNLGYTVLDWCKYYNFRRLSKILIEYGAM